MNIDEVRRRQSRARWAKALQPGRPRDATSAPRPKVGSGGCRAVYLTNADRCNHSIRICSGPYDSEEEALAACPGPVPGTISTTCCPGVLLPASLTATFFNTSGCECLEGLAVPLVNNPGFPTWSQQGAPADYPFGGCIPGEDIRILLSCTLTGWEIAVSCPGGASVGGSGSASFASCGPPLNLSFSGLSWSGGTRCCTGTFGVVVTP